MQATRQAGPLTEPTLNLQAVPETRQLAAPRPGRVALLMSVAGNLLVAAALMGGLLLAPALLAGWIPGA